MLLLSAILIMVPEYTDYPIIIIIILRHYPFRDTIAFLCTPVLQPPFEAAAWSLAVWVVDATCSAPGLFDSGHGYSITATEQANEKMLREMMILYVFMIVHDCIWFDLFLHDFMEIGGGVQAGKMEVKPQKIVMSIGLHKGCTWQPSNRENTKNTE